jgi:hypothetical protein
MTQVFLTDEPIVYSSWYGSENNRRGRISLTSHDHSDEAVKTSEIEEWLAAQELPKGCRGVGRSAVS